MNTSSFVWASAILLVGATGGAQAHHSAAQFDFQNTVNVTGVVKVAQFANPHGKFILSVTDDKRGTRDIEFEAHSRNNMYRQGLRPDMMSGIRSRSASPRCGTARTVAMSRRC
jgi:hypothetical protein